MATYYCHGLAQDLRFFIFFAFKLLFFIFFTIWVRLNVIVVHLRLYILLNNCWLDFLHKFCTLGLLPKLGWSCGRSNFPIAYFNRFRLYYLLHLGRLSLNLYRFGCWLGNLS